MTLYSTNKLSDCNSRILTVSFSCINCLLEQKLSKKRLLFTNFPSYVNIFLLTSKKYYNYIITDCTVWHASSVGYNFIRKYFSRKSKLKFL